MDWLLDKDCIKTATFFFPEEKKKKNIKAFHIYLVAKYYPIFRAWLAWVLCSSFFFGLHD